MVVGDVAAAIHGLKPIFDWQSGRQGKAGRMTDFCFPCADLLFFFWSLPDWQRG